MQICNDLLFRFLLIFEALAKRTYTGQGQHHGFHARLTTDIYPADLGWTVDWKSNERQEWYHDMTTKTMKQWTLRKHLVQELNKAFSLHSHVSQISEKTWRPRT